MIWTLWFWVGRVCLCTGWEFWVRRSWDTTGLAYTLKHNLHWGAFECREDGRERDGQRYEEEKELVTQSSRRVRMGKKGLGSTELPYQMKGRR